MLSYTTKIGSEVRIVTVEDYVGLTCYSQHIRVSCDGESFVLNKGNFELVGIIGADGYSITNNYTATRFAKLEQKYGFLEVVEAFARGSRGVLKEPCAKDLQFEEMYTILSPYILEYWKFVIFSKSDASPTEIRAAFCTFIGIIIVDLKPAELQTILQNKGDLSQTKSILESLHKCSVLYMERNLIAH